MNLGRVLVPIPTPFDEKYHVDYRKANRIARKVAESENVDAIIIQATSGEFFSLSFQERVDMYNEVRSAVDDKPLIAGVSANTTAETIALTEAAQEAGADAALIMPLGPLSQEEIYRHIEKVAKYSKIPIILYNIPFGAVMSTDTVARLAKMSNVVGIKEGGPDPFLTARVLEEVPDFKVYAVSATKALLILVQGGYGVVSDYILASKVKSLIQSFTEGDLARALEIQREILKIEPVWSTRPSFIPAFKYIFKLLGLDPGPPRPPLMELTAQEKEFVRKILAQLGVELS